MVNGPRSMVRGKNMTNVRKDRIQLFLDGTHEHTTQFKIELDDLED